MNVRAIKTRVFKEGEDLAAFIHEHIKNIPKDSILVVTSKIVALAENRVALENEKDALVRAESEWQKKTLFGKLTFKDGLYMWNAGIDASNGGGKIVLLPRDSFASAAKLRSALQNKYGLTKLGILITDSRIMPLRAGVVGVALGYAGFKGLRDYRGKKDIFGRALVYTQTDLADSLASAAVALMGEGSERRPLCLIERAPVEFVSRVAKNELIVAPERDMYAPLFRFPARRRKR